MSGVLAVADGLAVVSGVLAVADGLAVDILAVGMVGTILAVEEGEPTVGADDAKTGDRFSPYGKKGG